jgi:hypothetical protein
VVVSFMGRPHRFARGGQFKSFTGLVSRASDTGQTDRKGQPMSKAGPSLLRSTLQRAADNARAQDPQLAAIYYTQMVERGANHTKALCVVAAHLAERAWAVMVRGTPYVVRDTDGRTVSKAEPRPSSPSAGRCPRRSAGGGGARKWGRSLTKSSWDMS